MTAATEHCWTMNSLRKWMAEGVEVLHTLLPLVGLEAWTEVGVVMVSQADPIYYCSSCYLVVRVQEVPDSIRPVAQTVEEVLYRTCQEEVHDRISEDPDRI